MRGWRPDDWNNSHTPMQDDAFTDLLHAHFRRLADAKHIAYEAGADAYEEALKRGRNTVVVGATKGRISTACNIETGESPGYIVFIPEEENEWQWKP